MLCHIHRLVGISIKHKTSTQLYPHVSFLPLYFLPLSVSPALYAPHLCSVNITPCGFRSLSPPLSLSLCQFVCYVLPTSCLCSQCVFCTCDLVLCLCSSLVLWIALARFLCFLLLAFLFLFAILDLDFFFLKDFGQSANQSLPFCHATRLPVSPFSLLRFATVTLIHFFRTEGIGLIFNFLVLH